jgi:uncharacterized protein (DUF1015 family)
VTRARSIAYRADDADAFEAVATGRSTAAFLLNPPSVTAVRAVCLAGELMPEKSTYFYPTLATGWCPTRSDRPAGNG